MSVWRKAKKILLSMSWRTDDRMRNCATEEELLPTYPPSLFLFFPFLSFLFPLSSLSLPLSLAFFSPLWRGAIKEIFFCLIVQWAISARYNFYFHDFLSFFLFFFFSFSFLSFVFSSPFFLSRRRRFNPFKKLFYVPWPGCTHIAMIRGRERERSSERARGLKEGDKIARDEWGEEKDRRRKKERI